MKKIALFGLFTAALLLALTALGGGARVSASCTTGHTLCVVGATQTGPTTWDYQIQGCGFQVGKKAYVQVNGFGPPTQALTVPVDSSGCINTTLRNVANNACISAYQSGVKNAVYLRVANGTGTP